MQSLAFRKQYVPMTTLYTKHQSTIKPNFMTVKESNKQVIIPAMTPVLSRLTSTFGEGVGVGMGMVVEIEGAGLTTAQKN